MPGFCGFLGSDDETPDTSDVEKSSTTRAARLSRGVELGPSHRRPRTREPLLSRFQRRCRAGTRRGTLIRRCGELVAAIESERARGRARKFKRRAVLSLLSVSKSGGGGAEEKVEYSNHKIKIKNVFIHILLNK